MAAVAGTAAVAMLLVAGTSVVTAAIAVALLGAALRTARGPLRASAPRRARMIGPAAFGAAPGRRRCRRLS